MIGSQEQQPGLIPPPREWTFGGLLGGLLLAALVLMPWAWLFVIVWALLATP
jgi:hypothetical protein